MGIIKQLIDSGERNINITVSIQDLRDLFKEIVEEVAREKEEDGKARMSEVTMSQTEACNFLGVSKATLWRWEKIGYLKPCSRMGAKPLYSKSVLEQLKKGGE